jgi:hypothetical protein
VRQSFALTNQHLLPGNEARTAGLPREEGRSYVVQDGDIMHIRAST